MTEVSELEALFPTPRRVTLGGGGTDVELLPIVISKLPGFSKAVTPATALLMAGRFQEAIETRYEDMRRAVAIASGLPEAEIDLLQVDDFVSLLAAVLEVNLDFFNRRVAPRLRDLATVIAPAQPAPSLAAPMDGSSSPPSSPAGGTPPPSSAS